MGVFLAVGSGVGVSVGCGTGVHVGAGVNVGAMVGVGCGELQLTTAVAAISDNAMVQEAMDANFLVMGLTALGCAPDASYGMRMAFMLHENPAAMHFGI